MRQDYFTSRKGDTTSPVNPTWVFITRIYGQYPPNEENALLYKIKVEKLFVYKYSLVNEQGYW